MKLYPYQENAVENAVNMLWERGNSLIVAGTGAGKTIMMAATIGRFFKSFKALKGRSPHVLVLVHRTEIHTQNHSKFSLVCPDIQTSEITSQRKSLKGNIHFGMVQTVAGIMPELEKSGSFFDMIVIDEAHHAKAGTYEEIINQNSKGNPNAVLLGVTATPNRGDKLPLIHLFDNFYQITSRFLIDSHYLVRPTFIDLSPVFETENGQETGHLAKNCKFDDEGTEILNNLIDIYIMSKEDGKSIIFAPNHEFCNRIYNRLKELGRDPAYLASGIDDVTRKSELEKFENGECEELINVDICTEGYDFPPLRNLVDFDTNGTHGQWVQKVGRVLRTAPGKVSCTVIDFGGNVKLYPNGIETEVNLEGAVKKEKGRRLTEADLFRDLTEKEEETHELLYCENSEYTPYHLPKGFESINDKDFGIAFAACGEKCDCLIVGNGNTYSLYISNKHALKFEFCGEFDECMKRGVYLLGNIDIPQKPITGMQVKILAPDYPTMTLDFYGANCCICLKTWKEVIADDFGSGWTDKRERK